MISLLYPSLLLVSVLEHCAKLFCLNLRDGDSLTKSRLCPGIEPVTLIWPWWDRGISVLLSLSQGGKQCLYFSLEQELQQSLNCHWDPGNPAASGCLGNALNYYIPSCQGRVPFLQLFSSVWTVMLGTASGHLWGSETGILRLEEEIVENLLENRAKFK